MLLLAQEKVERHARMLLSVVVLRSRFGLEIDRCAFIRLALSSSEPKALAHRPAIRA
jgi:hypothetical protein